MNVTRRAWQNREKVIQSSIFLFLIITLAALIAVPFQIVPSLLAAQIPLTSASIPFLVGITYLGGAGWIFFIHREQPSGRALVVFLASVALVTVTWLQFWGGRPQNALWPASIGLTAALFFHFAVVFPRPHPQFEKIPALAGGVHLTTLLLVVYTAVQILNTGGVGAGQSLLAPLGWYAAAVFILAMGVLIHKRAHSSSPVEREQIRTILLGALVSFLPLMLWGVLLLSGQADWANSYYLFVPLFVFPLASGYTIERYRLLYTNFILSRSLVYGALIVIVSLGYALLVTGAGILFAGAFDQLRPAIVGVVVFLLAISLDALRRRLERAVNLIFFRGEQAYQARLQYFSGELTSLIDIEKIIERLRENIQDSIPPVSLHIYIYDPLLDQYVATAGADGSPTSDLRFPTFSALVQVLDHRRSPLFLSEYERLPLELQPDNARISLLAAQLYLPLSGRQRLAGWVAMGPKASGEPYAASEVNFLDALSDQAVLAIERAQVVINMEKRVREMNVLTRVAQGINITLNLNDTLELIYAQTAQIIPLDDFHIYLLDAEGGMLIETFCIDHGERILARENQYLTAVQYLENEVIRRRVPLLTNDYERECKQAGIIPQVDLYAWLGVPLNAGAETIGALSLGNRDQSVVYTADQAELLQAIANLVAGAIVKARLLQVSQRRAHQLSILNEMARQLTSTLDLDPLLQKILQNAANILDCEAGSLFLVDEQTDELVFHATVGPVADDLLHQRLPSGNGVVGRAVKQRQPVTVNRIETSGDWSPSTDFQTGFLTRSLLAVPMQVKDRVIGAIEVINKKDGSPFIREDEELLASFTAQAAVVIENARLYMMTDQALAARVDELSVMQRIDRELNTSLDTHKAMEITLEWAMRQSGAHGGLIGLVQDDGFRVVAAEGYQDELLPYQQDILPADMFQLGELLQSGTVQRRRLEEDTEAGLLHNVACQLIVPIRREKIFMGFLILESRDGDAFDEDALNFVVRLSDHAAIAIANSQLYTELQAANVAKSEFVSFVSHELKNPMTSIKGYTELIAVGAVGPVSDGQMNFLNTIRSNVERMATLVSDLADVSRIEAGRLKLDFKPVSVKDAVDEVSRSLKRQVEDRGQQLTVDFAADLPGVWADRTRLIQVVTNLLSNAIKYTPNGGQILLAADAAPNVWDPAGAEHVIHFWVQDNGIGIAEEDKKKIFQKFFRSEDPKTREVTGTGLGLNITRSLVEMQGGKIWFDSEYRQGTTFHFTIPVAT
ncbi:MAG: GAF domain-containing protein [Anaerolineaceae bacterium]|nr:GAF domain-containing protein [Anaerolineaceae bacterium]